MDDQYEIALILSGPSSAAKSHLAETLQDVLLSLGYIVAADPDHGFVTPLQMRCKPGVMTGEPIPAIQILEVEGEA